MRQGSFGRSRIRPQTRDPNPAATNFQFIEPFRCDFSVRTTRFANVGGPVLHARPARFRRRRDRRYLALKRKHHRNIGIAAPTDMAEIAGIGLKIG